MSRTEERNVIMAKKKSEAAEPAKCLSLAEMQAAARIVGELEKLDKLSAFNVVAAVQSYARAEIYNVEELTVS